jgi:mannose-1-phosphate guanylyltransferase
MKALLLAAGLGSRLRPITNFTPKCLVEIDGRPLLDYWLDLLSKGGVDVAIINTHHLADVVSAYLEHHPFQIPVYQVYEKKLLGTAGTLLKNRGFYQDVPVILIHADNLSYFSLQKFIDTFTNRPKGVEITMMTFTTDAPENCGIVELSHDGIVQNFYEKSKLNHGKIANGAVYIVSSSVLNFIESLKKEEVDFSTEVIPAFLGKMNTFHNNIYHRDIGNPSSLKLARLEFPPLYDRYHLEEKI